ncbi:hypothetical protein [Methyloversatilis sp.]|uniref:hypothetical protein n=1 Tax=Methyloversatilis sp. TaxID=2569862 RepID=UPI0035B47B9F
MLYGFAITTDNGTEYGVIHAESKETATEALEGIYDGFEVEVIDAEDVVCSQYSGIMIGTAL